MTPQDLIGTSIILIVCVLGIYAFYVNYFTNSKSSNSKYGLTQRKYQKYKLISKINISHNTRQFRFELPGGKNQILGLPPGKNISFRFFESSTGDEIRRPYTPITSNREKGYFDVMIKIYSNGKMSSHLDTLTVNKDYIEARGPMGNIEYKTNGLWHIKQKKILNKYNCNKIGMICGGTGITPMLQLIREIIHNGNKNIQASMIFGNVSIDDILMRGDLEDIGKKNDNIHIRFIIDKAPTDGREWNEDVGYVTNDIIKERIFPAANDVIVFLCGPPIMVKICKSNLLKLGYDENRIIAF